MSSRSSVSWKLGVCLVLALGACVQGQSSAPAGEAELTPEEMELPAYDAFAGDLPPLILDAWVAQSRGKLLVVELQRQLYDFGLAHTTDPRPWILLARDSMTREWPGFAVSQYGLALRADPQVAREQGVLSDVLQIAIHSSGAEESDANTLLVEYWGTHAIAAIDRARADLQANGDDQLALKLDEMRENLVMSANQSSQPLTAAVR